MDGPRRVVPGTADERDAALRAARDRIETSRRNLQDALAGIPGSRMTEPDASGEWSVKDLLGHIAFWDEQAVLLAERRAAGEEAQELDRRVVNEPEAAARAGGSLARVRDEFERAHAAVRRDLELAARLDPPTTLGVCGCFQGGTHEHDDERAAEIRAWRPRVGL